MTLGFESFGTAFHWTGVRPFAGVDALVGLEIAGLAERLIALVTLERLLAGVLANVHSERVRPHEAGSTHLALERPLVVVAARVVREVALRGEAFVAVTNVRLLARVNAVVRLQVALFCEALLAHVALERPFAGMLSHVCPEGRGPRVVLVAVRTEVHAAWS